MKFGTKWKLIKNRVQLGLVFFVFMKGHLVMAQTNSSAPPAFNPPSTFVAAPGTGEDYTQVIMSSFIPFQYPTRFGYMDTMSFNAYSQPVFAPHFPGYSLQSLSSQAPVVADPSPTQVDFSGILGESNRSSDFVKQGLPRRLRFSNPFDVQNQFDKTLSGPTVASCPVGYQDEDSYPAVDANIELSSEDRDALRLDVGERPPWYPVGSHGPLQELPSTGTDINDWRDNGYYRYNDADEHVFATDRVVWNIRAAGKLLAEEKVVMGVGELSTAAGPTSGHKEHQDGTDVDLRLIGPTHSESGYAMAKTSGCTIHDSSCYDRDNTFKMIKAFIQVDPYNIEKVFINDPKLRRMINNYMKDAYGITQVGGAPVARSCSGHDNHVHLSFKRNGTSPDVLEEGALR